jgi:hypothetical protein
MEAPQWYPATTLYGRITQKMTSASKSQWKNTSIFSIRNINKKGSKDRKCVGPAAQGPIL